MARHPDGWFPTLVDAQTGRGADPGSFSTLETGLASAGALFARRYFRGDARVEGVGRDELLGIQPKKGGGGGGGEGGGQEQEQEQEEVAEVAALQRRRRKQRRRRSQRLLLLVWRGNGL